MRERFVLGVCCFALFAVLACDEGMVATDDTMDVGAFSSALSAGDMWLKGPLPGTTQRYPKNFNIFSFGDIKGIPHSWGPMAAGGDIELQSFSLNMINQPIAAVAGGNINVVSGSINKDIYYGGTYTESQVGRTGRLFHDTPIDFARARWDLTYLSAKAAFQTKNRNYTLQNGTLTFSGITNALNIFEINASDLSSARAIAFSGSSNGVVLINVPGCEVTIQNVGIAPQFQSRILWNMPDAESLYLAGVGMQGSILAPNAEVELFYGNFHGTLVAANVEGPMEFYYTPFIGHNRLTFNLQETTQQVIVSGQGEEPDHPFEQAEAVSWVSHRPDGATIVTVLYNDRTTDPNNPTFVYPEDNYDLRWLYPGASVMGYSVSTDGGQTFEYQGTVPPPEPPPGEERTWDAIWGDPAIASLSPTDPVVYMSGMAVSHEAFEEADLLDGLADGIITNDTPHPDGYCVARSDDHGVTFDPADVTCFKAYDTHDSPLATFHDGNALAVVPTPAGGNHHDVYVAGLDADSSRGDGYNRPEYHKLHVFRKKEGEPNFSTMEKQPFSSLSSMLFHPRMRAYGPYLYIAGLENIGSTLFLSSLHVLSAPDGDWSEPVALASPVSQTVVMDFIDSPVLLKSALQFSFDVGLRDYRSPTSDMEWRVVFARDPEDDPDAHGRFQLWWTLCYREPFICLDPVRLTDDDAADHFQPVLKYGGGRWMAVWLSQAGGKIAVSSAELPSEIYDPPPIIRQLKEPVVPCATTTTTVFETPYWGDYNDVSWLGDVANHDSDIRFISPYTINAIDGTECSIQGKYTAEMHVGASLFF